MALASLIATGTKVWLDGVEPDELQKNRAWGVTGATSNPTIVSKIIGQGHFDGRISELIGQGLTDDQIAWALDDELVESAQKVFLPAWERTKGNDGYVSFELDPLIEDEAAGLDNSERVRRYLELGQKWSAGHQNRMIKVPATAAGLDALEGLAAAGVTINVTLMFTERQYQLARDAIWRGARRREDGLRDFKSVYSIFVSRVDVYTRGTRPRPEPRRPGEGRDRQRQAGLAGEPGVLAGQGAAAAAGDRLRQHRGQEAGRPAGQVRGGVRRRRHPDQPAGHERGRGEVGEDLHPPHRPDAVAGASSAKSTRRWTWRRWSAG